MLKSFEVLLFFYDFCLMIELVWSIIQPNKKIAQLFEHKLGSIVENNIYLSFFPAKKLHFAKAHALVEISDD